MAADAKSFVPRTRIGWVGVGLGFAVLAVIVATFILSDSVTNGGSEMAPVWLRLVVIAGILAVSVPAVVIGVRSRRTDRSFLGTTALVIASVIGGWTAFTGLVGIFIE